MIESVYVELFLNIYQEICNQNGDTTKAYELFKSFLRAMNVKDEEIMSYDSIIEFLEKLANDTHEQCVKEIVKILKNGSSL